MAKGAVKAKQRAAKDARRAVAQADRQVRIDTALLVDAFEEALMDFVLVVCDNCGHEFAESSEFNFPSVLPCFLCGADVGHASPRHDEVLAEVRASLAAKRLTLSGVAAAA